MSAPAPAAYDALTSLSDRERSFVLAIVLGEMKPMDAFKHAEIFSENDLLTFTPAQIRAEVAKLINKSRIKGALEYLAKPSSEIATDIYKYTMLAGTQRERLSAAKFIAEREDKKSARDAAETWKNVMLEVGAEIVKPIRLGETESIITMEQLISGEAQVRLGPKAIEKLLKLGGAPWNDKIPSATLSDLQMEILTREEREIIVHGGSGVGKSVLGGCFIFLGMCIPGFRTAIVGATYDHAAHEFEYAYKAFMKVFGKAATTSCAFINKTQHHDMIIGTIWGSFAKAYSTDREQGAALLGKEFDLLVLAEGSHVDADILDRKALRALDRRAKSQRICDCNPKNCDEKKNPSHFYLHRTGRVVNFTTPKNFEGCSAARWELLTQKSKGVLEDLHVGGKYPWLETAYLREASCIENPSYSVAAFESRRDSLPPDVFAEQYLGLMTRRTGLVYKEFAQHKHVKSIPVEKLATMKFGFGIDTGKNFAALLLGITPDREKWVLGEVTTKEQSLRENAEDIKEMVYRVLDPVLHDEEWDDIVELVELWMADPASQHKEDLYEELNVPIMFEQQELLGSIDRVRTWLKEDELYFNVDGLHDPMEGRGIIWEMMRYRWKGQMKKGGGSKAAQEPVKVDDHGCDALRIGMVPLDTSGPPITKVAIKGSFTERFARAQQEQMMASLKSGMGEQSTGDPYRDFRRSHGL